jgi:hypothetical protein
VFTIRQRLTGLAERIAPEFEVMGAGQEAVAAASLPRADAAVASSVKDNRHFSFVDDFVKRNCAEREVCSLRRLCVLCGEASVASKRNPL